MLAGAVADSSGTIQLVAARVLPPGAHEVRVAVDATGICHTDLAVSRRPGIPLPLILGHEATGMVTEVGDAVTSVKPGDRVVTAFAPGCGTCFYCRRGERTQCTQFPPIVTGHRQLADGTPAHTLMGLGAFAPQLVCDERKVVPVTTSLPPEQLAILGCSVATGVGAALWTARVAPGSRVLVIGVGGVGHFVVQGARMAGAEMVIAVDRLASKRDAALRAGATVALDPGDGEVAARVRDLTDGHGVDYGFDVVGHPAVLATVLDSIRPRGTAVVVGMSEPDAMMTVSPYALMRYEKTIVGSFYGSTHAHRDFPFLIEAAESGRLDLASPVTTSRGMASLPAALRGLDHGDGIRHVALLDQEPENS